LQFFKEIYQWNHNQTALTWMMTHDWWPNAVTLQTQDWVANEQTNVDTNKHIISGTYSVYAWIVTKIHPGHWFPVWTKMLQNWQIRHEQQQQVFSAKGRSLLPYFLYFVLRIRINFFFQFYKTGLFVIILLFYTTLHYSPSKSSVFEQNIWS